MDALSEKLHYLKSLGGLLLLLSCYATWSAWVAGLLGLVGFSLSRTFLSPVVSFIDPIRVSLFFVALLLFILGSLRQGMPALALAVIGGLLLYTGYYVRPGDLPLLLGAAALLSSYFLGRRGTPNLAGAGGGVLN